MRPVILHALPNRSRSPEARAAQIADATVTIWQEIDAALAPVIGQRGVVALYHRSIHLASQAHPWLPCGPESGRLALDLPALRAALARQNEARACLGGAAHLHRFRQLLSGLIGPSLTERLLGSAWAHAAGGPLNLDTLP
jgi:hypothetical protein